MQLGKIKQVYEFINGINPTTKTLIIILLVGIIVGSIIKYHTNNILKDYIEYTQDEKKIAEDYTQTVAPMINEYVQEILIKDQDATNVILLNYHNTLTSTHGLSYRYLTALTEQRRGAEAKNCVRIWKELEFINYDEEITKINNTSGLHIADISNSYTEFPKITELLQLSKAKSASFYPIHGIGGPVGMLIIIYQTETDHARNHQDYHASREIQALSSLLDYNNLKKLFKDNEASRFKSEFKRQYEN